MFMALLNHRDTVFPGSLWNQISPGLPILPAIPRNPVQVGINMKKPWPEYSQIMEMDQAGHVILAHKRNKPQKMVIIKEVKGCSRDWLRHLRTTKH
jgi:hypothetical protein